MTSDNTKIGITMQHAIATKIALWLHFIFILKTISKDIFIFYFDVIAYLYFVILYFEVQTVQMI